MITKLITLSSDFGPGNIGCGAMEAVIYEICPESKVVHLCHAIEPFNVKEGAKMLEGVAKLPVGFHVGVVDPGVGTLRKGIAIQTKRGDFLIGPDSGLLRPASEFLGGISAAYELANERYRRNPVSPIFHGRDIFAPAAAYLAKGIKPEDLGPKLNPDQLAPAPYPEARWAGDQIECQVIHINENGSLFLNLHAEELSKQAQEGHTIDLKVTPGARHLVLSFCRTFGEVAAGEALILKDDFGRVEVAINQGDFASKFHIRRGDRLTLRRKHG
ncbi:MAG: SAM-dependent chlorinase/fluorinase [Deltaproteobacteria bacterium]|nr:SAM-dependent chlorinase/fluorinase [Deltaproteobacteria bacterium]